MVAVAMGTAVVAGRTQIADHSHLVRHVVGAFAAVGQTRTVDRNLAVLAVVAIVVVGRTRTVVRNLVVLVVVEIVVAVRSLAVVGLGVVAIVAVRRNLVVGSMVAVGTVVEVGAVAVVVGGGMDQTCQLDQLRPSSHWQLGSICQLSQASKRR